MVQTSTAPQLQAPLHNHLYHLIMNRIIERFPRQLNRSHPSRTGLRPFRWSSQDHAHYNVALQSQCMGGHYVYQVNFSFKTPHLQLATVQRYSLATLKTTLRDVPPRATSQPYTYVAPVRTDTVRKPLQPPYESPFKVLKRDSQYSGSYLISYRLIECPIITQT